jgi:hypothetical protein
VRQCFCRRLLRSTVQRGKGGTSYPKDHLIHVGHNLCFEAVEVRYRFRFQGGATLNRILDDLVQLIEAVFDDAVRLAQKRFQFGQHFMHSLLDRIGQPPQFQRVGDYATKIFDNVCLRRRMKDSQLHGN